MSQAELHANDLMQTDGYKPLDVTSGGLHVRTAASEVFAITFQNSAVVAAAGAGLTVGGYRALTVDVDRTATSGTVLFYGVGPGGVKRAIMGVRLIDFATAISTTGAGETWVFDISGLTTVTMEISPMVAGAGSITVKGKAVA